MELGENLADKQIQSWSQGSCYILFTTYTATGVVLGTDSINSNNTN